MEKLEQENIVYRTRIGEIEERLKGKDEEVRQLKEKLAQIKVMEKENLCGNIGSSSTNFAGNK